MRALLIAVLAAPLAVPAAAAGAPVNDLPAGAAAFEPYLAANGRPRDLQAVADLAEATADPGVPRCLGAGSFARTAWYRVAAAPVPQEIAVDAIGRTLEVLDLAAFVQPPAPEPPQTATANACAGAGAGGSTAAEEATAGVSLRVPAGRDVLVQVGRRGPARSPDADRALLSLDARPLAPGAAPAGDAAGAATPIVAARRANRVPLAGATVGEEDPAHPACPSLGTVWRRIVPGGDGRRLVSVEGRAAATLAAHSGVRPSPRNALDCVVRSGRGRLELRVRVKRKRPLWVRIGTGRPAPGAGALLRVAEDETASVIDGGPGGFDPTPGGAGGGLPTACERARAGRARVTGPRLRGPLPRGRNVRLVLAVRGSALCDVRIALIGPGGHVYAERRAPRLRGRSVVRLTRIRRLAPGRYRLSVVAASELGGYAPVRSAVKGRLR